MIESVKIQQAIEHVEQAVEKEVTEAQQPSEEDVARFDQNLGQEPGAGGQNAEAHQGPAAAPVQNGTPSMGETILQSIENMKTAHSEKLEKVKQTLETMTENQSFSPEELLKVQWDLFQATFQVEMTSKVADKTDQGVSTLLRSQS